MVTTNWEKLVSAGVFDPEHATQTNIDFINNQLSDDEVQALISIKAKAGGPPLKLQSPGNFVMDAL